MKNALISSLFVALVLAGCSSSEQAPGYDAASKDAAEALAKNGNDLTKLTPEQRAALEKASKGYPGGSMQSTTGGAGSAPAASSGMPSGYGTPNGGR